MRARNFVSGSTGIIAAGVLLAMTLLVAEAVSAKILRPGEAGSGGGARDAAIPAGFEPAADLRFASLASRDKLSGSAVIEPLAFGQAGQTVVLQPVDAAAPLATPSLAVPSYATPSRMSAVPYLSAATVTAEQAGFAGGDSSFAWPGDSSGLARHMAAHEPQRVISAADFWWLLLVGIMLVTYQLRRKHIFLRPKPFGF